jgi:hypothetical protein
MAHKVCVNTTSPVPGVIEKYGLTDAQVNHILRLNDTEQDPGHRPAILKEYLMQLLRENA